MNGIKEKLRNGKRAIRFTAVFALLSLFLIFSPALSDVGEKGDFSPFELYTFAENYREPDGTIASVYASGDSDFRYYHDENGYVLTPDREGYLHYAKNADGRIEDGGVRWNASAFRKSYMDKMTASEVAREKNPQLETAHEDSSERPSVLSESGESTVYNVVIFISFAGSRLTEADIPTEIRETFSNDLGTYNSLKNYFSAQTAGEKELVNLFATEGSAIYVYQSPNNRSHYALTLSDRTRRARERELLTNAVAAFNDNFGEAVPAENLDSDGDGYVDAVSFVILDRPVSTQGSILWPHKWHMASIAGSAEISGVPIGVYSLNFTASHFVTYAHETGHVLGAPDYYAGTNNAMPLVAEWDVMSITKKSGSPANMLAYTRKKYLGMRAGTVETVRAGETVTLKNAADVRGDDMLAVRIPTDVEGVYVYAEYRARAEREKFDGGQTAYGLVVYRVNENVGGYGNINAKSLTDYANIEVFVYRKGGANDLNSVYSAALNKRGVADFNAVGSGTDTPLTVNAKTALDVCFSDVAENGDGTVSFTVAGDGIKSDYDGDFRIKGAEISDWTYFAEAGERFTVNIGRAIPTSEGGISVFADYDETALKEVESSTAYSKTFEVTEAANAVERLTLRIRDSISSCQMNFVVVTSGISPRKAEISAGTDSTLVLGNEWDKATAKMILGERTVPLSELSPLAFNAWSGVGERRAYFYVGEELYYYDFNVADSPVYLEPEVGEVSILVGEELPDTLTATVHFASGLSRKVGFGELETSGFTSAEKGSSTAVLTYRDGEGGGEARAEIAVAVAQPANAAIAAPASETDGESYPTAELVSDDGTVNFGDMAVSYNLDYGTETVAVSAYYGESGESDWFTVAFSSSSITESGIYTATVTVYRSSYGRAVKVLEMNDIEFRVLKSINRVTILAKNCSEEENGYKVLYLADRENWELSYLVEYFDGSSEEAELTAKDGDIELDIPYVFSPPYLGHEPEGLPLIIKNTAVEIVVSESHSYYGETLVLHPYAVMADGTERELSENHWRFSEGSSYNPNGAIGVPQNIRLELTAACPYLRSGGAVCSEIQVAPIDGLKEIELVEYKRNYEYGDADFSVGYLRTIYYGGRRELVSPNPKDITVEGFDTTVITGARYKEIRTVEVSFRGKTVEAEIEIINPVVTAKLEGLSFDGEAGGYLKNIADGSPFRFNVSYKNEATETVDCEMGGVAGYTIGALGIYAAEFNLEKDGDIIHKAKTKIINCVTDVRSVNISETASGKEPSTVELKFGEAVGLSAFTAGYTVGAVRKSLVLGKNVAYTATQNYSLLREGGGASSVDVKVPVLREAGGRAVSFTLRINVAPKIEERILSETAAAADVEIKRGSGIIVLQNETTVAELLGKLKSDYLTIRYKGGSETDFAGGFSENAGRRVFDAVEIVNGEGTVVATYKVCLYGDADGDGRRTREDVEAFALRILERSDEVYDAEAAGGSLDLKSFVKLVKMLNEEGATV